MLDRPIELQPDEEKIGKYLLSDFDSVFTFDKCEEILNNIPVGKLSMVFIEKYLKPYDSKRMGREIRPNDINFRFALENYINLRSSESLRELENIIKQMIIPDGLIQNKLNGTYLMPLSIFKLMRGMYLLNDEELIALLRKYFPLPSSSLFIGNLIPQCVKEEDEKINKTLERFKKLKDKEPIIKIIQRGQRIFRKKRRYSQTIERIKIRDFNYLEENKMSAEELVRDANKPYTPQCHPKLATRIMNAVRWVSENKPAFSEIKHITRPNALKSIFNDGGFGQGNLRDLNLPCTSSLVNNIDLLNGDANVFCFGTNKIAPIINGTITITLNVAELKKDKNIPVFFKLRDLQYRDPEKRSIKLGNKIITFCHTEDEGWIGTALAYLHIFDKDYPSCCGGDYLSNFRSVVQKSTLISDDLERIHEICILNFFRFIDKLYAPYLGESAVKKYIKNFYKEIYLLNDNELVKFIMDIEKNITDIGEVDFYGAHRFDFSTIVSITETDKNYVLHLPDFIEALNRGEVDELRLAHVMIPELFMSYRFIDYLLLKVTSQDSQYYLDDLRKRCESPKWIEYISALKSSEHTISWEFKPEEYMSRRKKLVVSTDNSSDSTEIFFKPTKSNSYFYFTLAIMLCSSGVIVLLLLALKPLTISIGASLLFSGISFFGLSYNNRAKSVFDNPIIDKACKKPVFTNYANH